MLQPDVMDPRVLGRRIAEARKARGLTQEASAAYLGCSRPTYIAIEKGDRSAKAAEIVKLATYFGCKVHELVWPGEPVIDFQTRFRAVAEGVQEGDRRGLLAAIEEFQRFVEDYGELERINHAPLCFNYPPEVTLVPRTDAVQLAESLAVRERRRLGLGDQPIIDLRTTLEWDAGVRIFYGALPPAIAGIYIYTSNLGCCIFINRDHPPERRRVSMLQAYGRLIVNRHTPGIDYLGSRGRKPVSERFTEAFALGFLVPENSLRPRFHEIVAATDDFQAADLFRLCHFYSVSIEAMTLRLEQLALIPRGTWQRISEPKSTSWQATEEVRPEAEPALEYPFPDRYLYLAAHAYERGEIGDSELTHYFRCDLVAAREIVSRAKTSWEIRPTGEELPLRLDFHYSLLGGTS